MKKEIIINSHPRSSSSDRKAKRKRDHQGFHVLPASPEIRSSSGSSITSSYSSKAVSSRLARLATPRQSSSWKKPTTSDSSGSISTVSSSSKHRSTSEISSRLARLATPRASSARKKPGDTPSSRESSGLRKRRKGTESRCLDLSDEETIPSNERSFKSTNSKTWKDLLSPKLSKLLSSISPTSPVAERKSKIVRPVSKSGQAVNLGGDEHTAEDSSVPDILTTPIISSLVNHPYHLSCPPACIVKHGVFALQREVMSLTDELALKDRCISEMEQKLKKHDDMRDMESSTEVKQLKFALSAEAQRLSQALSPELETWPQQTSQSMRNDPHQNDIEDIQQPDNNNNTRYSIESLGTTMRDRKDSFSEFVIRLSGELDSKIDEISELEQIQKPANDTATPPRATEVKELVSSLHKLKQEYSDLSRSSIESIHLAQDELGKASGKIMNYVNEEVETSKIMNYVHEEVETAREGEINGAHAMLLLELAAAQNRNSMLEEELTHLQAERNICVRCKQDISNVQPSPLPTLESWSHFCSRFRQALTGSEDTPSSKRKLDVLQAETLIRELSFDTIPCEEDEDMFVDALYSP